MYGTVYALRSYIALVGIGANPQADAVYVGSRLLAAGSQWSLTFEKGELPPGSTVVMDIEIVYDRDSYLCLYLAILDRNTDMHTVCGNVNVCVLL